MNPTKVLTFSPYGEWPVHSQVDTFLTIALKLRGADARLFGCRGLCSVCNVNLNKNREVACNTCWYTGTHFASQFGLNLEAIDQWLSPAEDQKCLEWAQSVVQKEFRYETFLGVPVGNSVHSFLYCINRTGNPDFESFVIKQQAFGLLHGGARLVQSLKNLCVEWRPDHALVLQAATLPPQRIFFETMRHLGIPVLVHERGPVDGSFNFRPNEHFCEQDQYMVDTQRWFEVPLSLEELEETKLNLAQRSKGINTNFNQMYRRQADIQQFLASLNLDPDRPLASIFVSSGWEYRVEENIKIFDSQFDGIHALCHDLVKNGFQVAVRHHPNVIVKTHQDFRFLSIASDLANELPREHVRVIMPTEPASSYPLMWMSQAIFTFGSSSGLEATLRGTATYNTVRNYYALSANMPHPKTPEHVARFSEDFPSILKELTAQSNNPCIEPIRAAFRSYHFNFLRYYFKFKGIGITDVYQPVVTINDAQELLAGYDPTLDALCDYFMKGKSLVPEISTERAESKELLDAETKWFEKELAHIIEERAMYADGLKSYRASQAQFYLTPLTRDGIGRSKEIIRDENVGRLRHKSVVVTEALPLPLIADAHTVLSSLEQMADSASGEYVGFFSDETRALEGRLNYALYHFSKEERPQAFVHGSWIRGSTGMIEDEWMTYRKPERTWDSFVKKLGGQTLLSNLLGSVLWTTSGFRDAVQALKAKLLPGSDQDALAYALFQHLEASSTFWYPDDPLCEISRIQKISPLSILS